MIRPGIRIILQYATGVILVGTGLFALFTPLTPGALLALVAGLVLLIGKERTESVLKIVLGSYLYKKLRVEYFLSKSPIE